MSTACVTVTLFGQFALCYRDDALFLPTEKSRALLAYLLIEPQRIHRRNRLAALLWPNLANRRALHNLTIALSAIRRLVDDGEPLLHDPDSESVALNPQRWDADTRRFSAFLAKVAQHSHRNVERCPLCAVQFGCAAELAAGPLLAEIDLHDCEEFHEWLVHVREQSFEQVVLARKCAAAFALNSGVPALARRELQALLRAEPWREEVLRELMRVHAALGERTTALRLFQRGVDAVRRHVGAEVEPATRQLAAAIRNNALPPLQSPFQNCPPPATEVFPRPEQTAPLLDALLSGNFRLVTLTGIGGSGKSYLARIAARHLHGAFEGGIVYLNCESMTSSQTVLLSLAAALSCELSGSNPPLQQIGARLAAHDWLFVLDDCSQVNDQAGLAGELLAALPQLTLLLTARHSCGLRSERVLEVGSFSADDDYLEALHFLQMRCRALLPFQLTDDDERELRRIARAVGGLPLALELTVHHLRRLPVAVLADLLDQDPARLSGDMPDLPLRQRQIATLLDQSLADITEPALRLLSALSFAGGALDFPLLTALCEPNTAAGNLLNDLAERGLIQRSTATAAVHPLIRVLVQRAAPELRLPARRLFTRAVLAQLTLHDLAPGGVPAPAIVERLSRLYPDLRNAWQYACADDESAVLAASARPLYALLSYLNWYEPLTEMLVTAADRLAGDQAAAVLLSAARAALHAGRIDQAEQLIDRASSQAEQSAVRLRCRTLQACLLHERGDIPSACSAFAAITAAAQGTELPSSLIAEMTYHYARSAMVAGDLATAQLQAERCLPAARSAGDLRTVVLAESILAQLPSRAGDYRKALPLLERTLIDARAYGLKLLVIQSIGNLALTRALAGKPAAQVLPLLDELEQLTRHVGGTQRLAVILHSIASSALAVGAVDHARRAIDEARRLALQLPSTMLRLHLLESCGWLALLQGRVSAAEPLLLQVVIHPATSVFVRNNARRLLEQYRLPTAAPDLQPLSDDGIAALLGQQTI